MNMDCTVDSVLILILSSRTNDEDLPQDHRGRLAALLIQLNQREFGAGFGPRRGVALPREPKEGTAGWQLDLKKMGAAPGKLIK